MRFAFVTTNLAGGGAEKALLKIAAELKSRDHEADIWLLEDVAEHQVPSGVGLHVLGPRIGHGWLHKRLAAWRLQRAMAARAPYDFVVSTLPFADEVAHLARLPNHWCRIANTLSVDVDALAGTDVRKAARRLARYRRLYTAHPLIAVSHGVADDLRQQLQLSSRIEIVPNPFDRSAIAAAACAPMPGLPVRPYVIHVGRFVAQKRHDLLLDAWAQLDTDRLLVLLTAPNAKLDALIKQRGLDGRVVVAGFQSNPYPWIAQAELLVLCSDHEGLPNVLIESLLCGTPVVSTDCRSGPREILSAFPECLVPCGDALALAAAISSSLANPPDVSRADLGAYAADAVAASYERLAAAQVHRPSEGRN
jgi:glycosyltransferase involved in cell wall biosynthesis